MNKNLEATTISKKFILQNRIMLSSVPKLKGIYFLIKKQEIVYVGKSTDIISRIASHRRYHKDFDGYAYIEYDSNLDVLEAYFFCKFKPRYNYTLPTNNRILSVNRLKKKLDATAHEIKRYIRDRSIKAIGGEYYHFEDFSMFENSRTRKLPF